MLNQLSTSLQETVREVPFNSFGKILLADGQEYPRQLGGNCVLQNRALTDKLAAANITELQYITAQEKPHWVSLARDDGFSQGDTFMMDPFILHDEPLNISKAMRDGELIQDVHPLHVPNGVPSKVRAVKTADQVMEVQLHAPRPNNPSSTKHVMTYTYHLDGEHHAELPPVNYQVLAGLRQKMIELGVLRPSGRVSRVYLNPENGDMNMLHVGEKKIARHKSKADFDRDLAEIAGEFRLSLEELLGILDRGKEAYLKRMAAQKAA